MRISPRWKVGLRRRRRRRRARPVPRRSRVGDAILAHTHASHVMILYKDDEIIAFFYSEPQGPTQNPRRERLEFYCRRTSASTAPRTPRRACCPYAYVLITVLRVSRSCEHFPDGFDLHLLQLEWDSCFTRAQYEPALRQEARNLRARPVSRPSCVWVSSVNLLWTPHNLASSGALRTQIPTVCSRQTHHATRPCRRWRSNPSGKSSHARLTRSTVISTYA